MSLEDLKKILINKENTATSEELEKVNLIKSLFSNENCFFDIDMKLAIDILWFLGIKKDQLLDTYYELVSPKNFKKEKIVEIIDVNKM